MLAARHTTNAGTPRPQLDHKFPAVTASRRDSSATSMLMPGDGLPTSKKKLSMPAGLKMTTRRPGTSPRLARRGQRQQRRGQSDQGRVVIFRRRLSSRTHLQRESSRPRHGDGAQVGTSQLADSRLASRTSRRSQRRRDGSRCERRRASTTLAVQSPLRDHTASSRRSRAFRAIRDSGGHTTTCPYDCEGRSASTTASRLERDSCTPDAAVGARGDAAALVLAAVGDLSQRWR